MADDDDTGGGPPSTDDMLNALSSQIGDKSKNVAKAEDSASADAPVADNGDDGAGAEEARSKEADSDGEAEAPTAEEESKPAEAAKKTSIRTATGEIADAAAIFGLSGADDSDDDVLPDESDDLDDDFVPNRGSGGLIGAVVVVGILLVVGLFLGWLGQKRMSELERADVLIDSWVEIITLYDVHQEDIKQSKIKKHNKEQRAKVPIYGNLRIESEPEFADVYIECMPRDARCNNVGSKDAPSWDSHWVSDEETKEKKCVRDEDCRVCREAKPKEMAEEGFDPRALCSIYDAKCQAGQCFLPIRTATTMQSLYIGTLGGLEQERKYSLSIKLAGWLEERYEVTARDWSQQAIPGRDDSDRVFVKRFQLKPDPMAPPDIKAKVDAYLLEKAEAAAAMMKEMEAWQAQGN